MRNALKKGLIFDLDGTLWDTTDRIVPVWNEVLARHGQRAITKADMLGFMGKTPEGIARLMLPSLSDGDAMAIMRECFREEQICLRQYGGVLYPELEATLTALGQQCGLYLVSNCQAEYLDTFFAAHGLRRYFDDWETHGNTGLSKAENIRLIVRRNGLDQAAYVGDTALDKASADEAGIPFIFASYGFGEVPDARFAVKCFAELTTCADDIF